MKLFVTGAAGFLGNAIVRSLRSHGHEAVGLGITDQDLRKVERAGGRPVQGDLRTKEGLETAARGAREADGVIHAIKISHRAAPGVVETDVAKRQVLNLKALEDGEAVDRASVSAMLDALAGSGKPFVYSSSCAIFGNTGTAVFNEDSQVPAESVYGTWRAKHDRMLREASSRGIRTVVLRSAMIYGPHPDGMPLGRPDPANMHQQLMDKDAVGYLGKGDEISTCVHVDDYADLFVLALEKAQPGSVFIAGSEDYSRKTLALALSHAYGYRGKTRSWTLEEAQAVLGKGKILDFLFENHRTTSEKAKRVLGWEPTRPSLLEFALQEAKRATRP